jgi:hypothetical protein
MQRWLPARAPGSRAVAEKARFPPGRLLEHKIEPHRVAPDETRQKHVEKQTNHHNREGAQPTQRYFLNAQQQLPAQSGKRFDCAIKLQPIASQNLSVCRNASMTSARLCGLWKTYQMPATVTSNWSRIIPIRFMAGFQSRKNCMCAPGFRAPNIGLHPLAKQSHQLQIASRRFLRHHFAANFRSGAL